MHWRIDKAFWMLPNTYILISSTAQQIFHELFITLQNNYVFQSKLRFQHLWNTVTTHFKSCMYSSLLWLERLTLLANHHQFTVLHHDHIYQTTFQSLPSLLLTHPWYCLFHSSRISHISARCVIVKRFETPFNPQLCFPTDQQKGYPFIYI